MHRNLDLRSSKLRSTVFLVSIWEALYISSGWLEGLITGVSGHGLKKYPLSRRSQPSGTVNVLFSRINESCVEPCHLETLFMNLSLLLHTPWTLIEWYLFPPFYKLVSIIKWRFNSDVSTIYCTDNIWKTGYDMQNMNWFLLSGHFNELKRVSLAKQSFTSVVTRPRYSMDIIYHRLKAYRYHKISKIPPLERHR